MYLTVQVNGLLKSPPQVCISGKLRDEHAFKCTSVNPAPTIHMGQYFISVSIKLASKERCHINTTPKIDEIDRLNLQ